MTYTTAEDTVLNGTGLLTGATDVENDPLTAKLATGGAPAHGSVVINANGTFTYTPAANYNGTDSFTYVVNDGQLDSAPKTVTLTITPVNDAPVAPTAILTYTTAEDTVLNGTGLLIGATDVENDPLTAKLATGGAPAHGSVVINANGTFTYTPAANYNGTDSFTYVVNDGQLDSAPKTVTLTITPVNDAPVAPTAILTYTTAEDTVLNGTGLLTGATDVENDPLTAKLATGGAPAHGSVVINANGTFTYTPAANYNGTDSFTYVVNDGQLDSAPKTVTLTITPVNDAPVGADGTITTLEDTAIAGNVVMTDVDGNALTASVVTGPAHGSLIFNSDGSFSYTPDANFNGSDSFTYKVNDGTADSAIQTININITPVNDAQSEQTEQLPP